MTTREPVRTVTCTLCQGGGRVPRFLAAMYGSVIAPRGDTARCPSCEGRGVVRAVIATPFVPPQEDHDD